MIIRRPLWREPWLACFVSTAVIFIIQVFPPIGIILNLFRAPYWSVITLNLGFILIIKACLGGGLPRFMLAVPFIWFVGYYILAGYSSWTVSALDYEIKQEINAAGAAFAPLSADVIIISEAPLSRLSLDYNLKQFYRPPRKNCRSTIKTEVNTNWCDRKGDVQNGCTIMAQPWTSITGKQLCWEQKIAEPLQPAVTITDEGVTADSFWYRGEIRRLSFLTTSGEKFEVTAGRVASLSWFPSPIIGCSLVDQPSSWTCFFRWGHGDLRELGTEAAGQSEVDVVATVLGLSLR